MRAVIAPIGVTQETVEGIFRSIPRIDLVITVTVPGYEEAKKPILEALKSLASLIGAEYHEVVVDPGKVEGLTTLYRILLEHKPEEIYLIGLTGSRYLLPPLSTVLLKYWRDTGATIHILHGIEGEEYTLEPLPGFYATAMRLSRIQLQLLDIIYTSREPISGKQLKEKYGYTHSIYSVLRDLERKGLLEVKRGRIEKTFPGKLVHALYKTAAEVQ